MSNVKQKIFIVEDDPFLMKVLSDRLRSEGFDVSGAGEGNEALRRVKSEKPDLVLLDIILPGKNGFEVLTEMRRDPDTKNTLVMIISNLGQSADIERGLALGVKDYVVKTDLDLSNLVEKVKELLVKKELDGEKNP